MKTISLCLLLCAPALLPAQTNVERFVRTIDSLSMSSFDHWKISPDLKSLRGMTADPTKPGFDDSRWEDLRLNQSVYPDSCWIRKVITLPRTYLGQPIRGAIKLLLSVDDYGYLWVNGESKGHFPWDGEFELTKEANPGQTFLVVIKAINTGGPLRLIRAEIRTEQSSSLRALLEDAALSFRVGEKLLGFDTYQTNARKKEDPGIDRSKTNREEKRRLAKLLEDLAARIDVDALGAGNVERFSASLEEVRRQLGPIRAFVKSYTLYFDANAHIDAAWLWRDKETIEVCKNTFSSVLTMMDARPDFTYTQSSAAYYDWMERLYPDLFRRIQTRVKDGRWEVVGGMWVEPDCNLPGGESWMRQLLYAKRYFRRHLGVEAKIGWNPDSFGYNLNMPAFYADAGIDAFITQKIGWNESNVFPYRLFWWESPDGSRILSYFPFDYVNTVDDPYRLVDWLRQHDANTGIGKMLILFGVGDHGGGPSDEMIDRIERLKKLDIYPSIEYGTAGNYLGWLKQQDLSAVPVWKDELYLEYHQGTYTTQAKMKEWNRKSEIALTNAEKFSSIASLYGRPYRGGDLEEAWRNVLFNQFHDILPGSGIREIYIDATGKYEQSAAIARHELAQSAERIAANVNTAQIKGTPVVILNPHSWNVSGTVTVPLAEGEGGTYRVLHGGKEVPSQEVPVDRYRRGLLFVARDVPALGYATYEMRPGRGSRTASPLRASREALENQLLRVRIDTATGWVKSIWDKRKGRELLAGNGNELQLLEDKPAAWDAWNIGLTGTQYPTRLEKIELVESGPVRATIRITRDYLKPGVKKDFPTPEYPNSFFTQEISLADSGDRIEFRTDADWWEEKTMVKVAFPLSFTDTVATYEIPYGTIARSTGSEDRWARAKVEVPAQRWADLSRDGYGVSLLNTSKYGYDIKGGTMRLSLLRSPLWPDPTADRGTHSIEYALYPHNGDWREGRTSERAIEYNNALIAVQTGRHRGALPASSSFLRLEPDGLVLSTLKKAEDSAAWIVQWYDAAGAGAEALLTLPKTPKSVVRSNAMEEEGAAVPISGTAVRVTTKPHGMVTLKIRF